MAKKKARKLKRKSNVNLYLRPEALDRIKSEADEFELSVSKYVAVLLSHRVEIVNKIRSGEIVVVP